MHIFIDESGSFVYTPEKSAWNSICALVIPERFLEEAECTLIDFKKENGCPPSDELKLGEVVDEMSYFRLLIRLAQTSCTLYGAVTDAHTNTPEALADHKASTVKGLLANVEKMHYEEGRQSVRNAADQVKKLSDQLHIQLICQISLMQLVVWQSVLYYAQHEPETLSSFVWRVDGKALEKKTEYESAFEKLLPAYLQTMSISDPIITVTDFDYSHMADFIYKEGEGPDYLKESYGINVDSTGALNIGKIFRDDIKFVNSKGNFGVQLADLLSAGLRRCLRKGFKDNLRAAAFLGRLMVQRPKQEFPVLLLTLGNEVAIDTYTATLVRMMRKQQRPAV
ncbi:DUF3800 domain-containing protein [Pseudomonas sp. S09G 359]|jgi:hypothetical protein|uniref:DUF3800 domain-containing protein n=1 Tax=Pseudomonas sp. S09G 359 TaxID=2054919 RepID=UPI0012FEF96C|nr:DUF3800 domain-containing protein [Pseudomonas sp. S09G 359]